MSTTKVITGVRVIMGIERPVIVFKLDGFPDVVRNPKQALTDLQNSGRITTVKSTNDPRFAEEIHACVGATLTGDLKAYKAGDEYTVTAGHPEIASGKANLGDKRLAEKEGVWVEGFLSIPLSDKEKMMNKMARESAFVMLDMFGFASTPTLDVAATPTTGFTPESDDAPENILIENAIGKPAKEGAKGN